MSAALPLARPLNDATSQADRAASAPAPERVRVDDRSLDELLSYAARYGALIHFYDLNDLPNGTWASFFLSDPALVGALQRSFDLGEIETTGHRLLDGVSDERRGHGERAERLRAVIRVLVRLLAAAEGEVCLDDDTDGGLASLLRRAERATRRGLIEPLRRLHAHVPHHRRRTTLERLLEEEGSAWVEMLGTHLGEVLTATVDELRLGAVPATDAQATMSETEHTPPIALYIAFVLLFAEARISLNAFSSRFVEFYYAEILKQSDIAPKPDQVYLTFTTAPTVDEASIPRGTRFSAGNDERGKPIAYAADTSLEVTAASVNSIGVHRVVYDRSTAAPSGVASGILTASRTVDFTAANGNGTSTVMEPASLGFVIATPVLMLPSGIRTVSITVTISYAPTAPVASERANATANASAAAFDRDAANASLVQLLEGAFALSYTTAGGWEAVAAYTVALAPSNAPNAATLTFSFVLPVDAPPLVTIATKPAPGAPAPSYPPSRFEDPGRPAVVAMLDQQALATLPTGAFGATTPFAILSSLLLASIEVSVSVSGTTAFTLTTPQGLADASQSVAIFGAVPAQYSALAITSEELFAKPLTSLSLAITWAALPVTSDAFAGYYKGYVLDADGVRSTTPLFDNTTFQAGFSVVNPGLWTLAESTPLHLFQTGVDGTTDPTANVLQTSVLVAPGVAATVAPAYYDPASSALELVLSDPPYAFGNSLYANNVMAASSAQVASIASTSAAAAASSTTADVAKAATANTSAPEKSYRSEIAAAIEAAISSLTGKAIAAIEAAIARSGFSRSEMQALLASLASAIEERPQATGSWLSRLWARFAPPELDASAVLANVEDWLRAHAQTFGAEVAGLISRAKTILTQARSIADTHAETRAQKPSVARPKIDAALQKALAALHAHSAPLPVVGSAATPPAPLPNPPWLPSASAISIDYTSSAAVILALQHEPNVSAAAAVAAPAPASAAASADFLHLSPFDTFASAKPMRGMVPLLAPVDPEAALYIDLSMIVARLSLLLVLSVGPDGWSSNVLKTSWEQKVGDAWRRVKVFGDTTNGLANSGIVTLGLHTDSDATPSLRVRLLNGRGTFPTVQSVIPNALSATWVPPNGAAELGLPKPPSTITQSESTLTGVGSIAQPMASFGGRPPAIGALFQKWMAERLRHKEYAVMSWDYAHLVLAAVPSLWQVAVVPVTDAATGAEAPGSVWIVVVAGPTTPNVPDPTVPTVDATVLTEVGELLEAAISPFVSLRITNPPYVRLTVDAKVIFSAENTADAFETQLQKELIAWLSPWPDAKLGTRPPNYYTRHAIAEFIRHRPYVEGLMSLTVTPDASASEGGWAYYTSAAQHLIRAARPTPSSTLATVYRS